VDDRCFPAWTSLMESDGREVRKDRRVRRLSMVRDDDTVMGMVLPETFLTNICMVSTGSGEAEGDKGDEERMLIWTDE